MNSDIQAFVDALQALLPKIVGDHPPLTHRLAITTGEPAIAVVVGGWTFRRVLVWLDGAAQTPENRTLVTLPVGRPDPGPNEFWVVQLINGTDPGYLAERLA